MFSSHIPHPVLPSPKLPRVRLLLMKASDSAEDIDMGADDSDVDKLEEVDEVVAVSS